MRDEVPIEFPVGYDGPLEQLARVLDPELERSLRRNELREVLASLIAEYRKGVE
jgi:hypothetical protein